VAVLGQRVPSGFPATVWVRATDGVSHRALSSVKVVPEPDSSFLPSVPAAYTDARGWAEIVATPVGHAVTMIFRARANDGQKGVWAGALFVSPGAPQLITRPRFHPDEEPEVDLAVPTVRTTAYVEIDDTSGRAWAETVRLPVQSAQDSPMPQATLHAPKLSPGLYWVVAAGDPAGASVLGPGTSARPFFVAPTDVAALALGTDPAGCASPSDPRDAARALSLCLALAAPAPVPRWVALDGFPAQHARNETKRARGLVLAMGALGVAAVLETLLLLRALAASREALRVNARASAEATMGLPRPNWTHTLAPTWTVLVALFVAILGFALLAAFLALGG
jgi:hypothetical protein